MWVFKKINIKNFLSYKNVAYEFKDNCATLIQGINNDDDGQESNGSGKSVLIEALHVVINGDSFRDILMSELIRYGEDEGEINLLLYNTMTEESLCINRKLFLKKPSQLVIKIDDKIQDFESVNSGNKKILEILGMNKEDIFSYFIINKDSYTPFLKSTDSEKKDVISKFSDFKVINGVTEKIEIILSEYDEQIGTLLKNISEENGKVFVYKDEKSKQKTPEQLRSQFIDQKNNQIEELKQKNGLLEESNNNHLKKNATIHSHIDHKISERGRLEEQKNKLLVKANEYFKEKLEEIEKKEKSLLNEKQNLNKDKKLQEDSLSEFSSFLIDLQKIIKGIIECPSCHYQWNLSDPDIDVNEAKEQIVYVTEEIDSNTKLIKAIESQIITINQKLQQFDKQKDEQRKANEDYNKAKFQILNLIQKCDEEIAELKSQLILIRNQLDQNLKLIQSNKLMINDLIVEIELVKNKTYEGLINYDEKIDISEKMILSLQDEKEQLISERKKVEEWTYLFKKFRTYLSNKCLQSIESFTNFYLEKINTNLAIQIDGYKLLKNGKLSETITTNILKDGLVSGRYGGLSNGEKMRIDICSILAIQKLINLSSSFGGMNMLFMDEIAESLDSLGIESIMDSLNELKMTVYMITHTNHTKSYTNILIVQKQNGISQII